MEPDQSELDWQLAMARGSLRREATLSAWRALALGLLVALGLLAVWWVVRRT